MISKTILASIIGIIIVGGVLGYQFYENSWIKSSAEEYYKCNDGKCDIAHVTYPENPQVLYGLQINKDKYVLGENIFVKINDIPPGIKTQALFFTPSGKQFYEITIDGDKFSSAKQYFKPQLLSNRALCNVSELVGEWTVMFESSPNETMNFQVMNEYLPGTEKHFKKESCGRAIPLDPGFIPPLEEP
jgi:hypothetical protein